MLKPVLMPIILSIIIAYVSYPLYKRIQKYITSKTWSALIVSILILLIIAMPLIFLVNTLVMQTQVVYTMSRKVIVTGGIFEGQCVENENILCSVINPVQKMMADPKTKYYLDDALKGISTSFINQATTFIFAIPKRMLEFFIMLFSVFYLLKDGPKLINWVKTLMPINEASSRLLFKRMKNVLYAMIYGYFFVAIIQGVLGGIGFFAVGISSVIFWTILMAIASLLPVIGTALVWVPAALFLILGGFIDNNSIQIWKGVGLFIYGMVIVSSADNLLRPKLVSTRANIHPVLVLLGVVGGIQIFGFVGLLIGPIILSIMVTLLCMYKNLSSDDLTYKKVIKNEISKTCSPTKKKKRIKRKKK